MNILKFTKELPTKLVALLITVYQKTLSPDHGLLRHMFPSGYCRFQPTCSSYAKQAILKYGTIKGCWLTSKRIVKCRPGNAGGWDPLI